MITTEIIGHLGQPPKLIESQSGKSFLTMSVAASSWYGDYKNTEWFNVKVFGKRGETLSNLLTKGTHVFVRGELSFRSYASKSGETKHQAEINANDIEILGGGRNRNESQVDETYDRPPMRSNDSYDFDDEEWPF